MNIQGMSILTIDHNIIIKDLKKIQMSFESELLTLILFMNQNGLHEKSIKNLIKISVDNSFIHYENNRRFFTNMYKSVKNNGKND